MNLAFAFFLERLKCLDSIHLADFKQRSFLRHFTMQRVGPCESCCNCSFQVTCRTRSWFYKHPWATWCLVTCLRIVEGFLFPPRQSCLRLSSFLQLLAKRTRIAHFPLASVVSLPQDGADNGERESFFCRYVLSLFKSHSVCPPLPNLTLRLFNQRRDLLERELKRWETNQLRWHLRGVKNPALYACAHVI